MAGGASDVSDKHLSYCVAMDGSIHSKQSLDTAMSLMNPGDKIIVLHVEDPEKDYLPYDDTAAAITDYATSRLVARVAKGDWSVRVVTKHVGEATKTCICRFVNDSSRTVDVLVLGVVGRKGPKDDPSIVGSTADYSLREAHMTAVLVRNRHFPEEATFVVATDGSDSANESVELARTMANAKDSINIVHMEDAAMEKTVDKRFTSSGIREYFESHWKADKRCSLTVAPKEPIETISAAILRFARDKGAHYIIIGADGVGAYASGKSVWGSVSDKVVKFAKCTVIVYQPRGKVYQQRQEGDTLTD